MTSSEYQRLCVLLDDLLLTDPVTESRLAVSVLHMMRNHPVFTDLYAPLFRPRAGRMDCVRDLAERGRRLAIVAAHLVRVAANRVGARRRRCLSEPCDVLLVSYLFDPQQMDNADDMYMGHLAQALNTLGCRTRLVRFDSTPGYRNANRHQSEAAREPVLDRFLRLRDEWRNVRQQWRESRVLAQLAPPGDDDVAQRLPGFASTHAFSMWSLLNLRRVQLVMDVLIRLQPKVLVTTYEGLPWERMLYARARAAVPGIRCTGYQQAPVFNNLHAITRALGPAHDPDVVWASSAHSAGQLLARANYPATIQVLGSKRHQATLPVTGGWRHPFPVQPGVLVAPEGILAECERLFGLAIAAAARLPECRFVLRLHPNMTFAQVRRHAPALLASMPRNVSLSDVDFATDVARAQIVLYRASSAIVTCAAAGALPVFVGDVEDDDLDPMYDIADLRPRVLTPEDFVRVVKQRQPCPPAVQEFAARYYDPLVPDRLADYVRSLDAHPRS